uniref:LamG-like jellyroll fold domain-containing protein n=1 Tax=Pyramimonas orientalis virus TaxID=455367 RepID=A0A7M3UNS0_POV01|nr:hypothetical protein HWQ62_00214 [Pyramimonas orientalis virus]
MTTFSSSGSINSNVWTHIAVVLDKENQLIKFYKDNVLEGSISAPDLNLVNDTSTISIGKNDANTHFSGMMDDVRLYDRVVTTTEMDKIFNEKYTNNLILHYDFEDYDHDNAIVRDESKYGNHGQLINKEIESEDFTKDIGEYAISGTAFKTEVDQYIQIPTTTDNVVQGKNLENCTMTAWVKTNNLNSFEPIIHKDGVFSFGLNYGHATLQLGDGSTLHPLPGLTNMAMDTYVHGDDSGSTTQYVSNITKIYGEGTNDYMFGNNSATDLAVPTLIFDSYVTNMEIFNVGGHFGAFYTKNRKLYMFGNNEYGQFGNGVTSDTGHAVTEVTSFLPFTDKITGISCSRDISLLLTEKGEVWGSGIGTTGFLGQGNNTSSSTFVKIPVLDKVVKVIAGGTTMLFLTENNECYFTGYSQPNGSNTSFNVPTKVILPGNEKIIDMNCTAQACSLLTEDKYLYMCGENSTDARLGNNSSSSGSSQFKHITYFQPGTPNEVKKMVSIHADTFILTVSGQVWNMGRNLSNPNIENGQYNPNRFLRGDQPSINGSIYFEDCKHLASLGTGTAIVFQTSDNTIYRFATSDGTIQLVSGLPQEPLYTKSRVFESNTSYMYIFGTYDPIPTQPTTEKLLTNVTFNNPITLSSDLPGQTLELTGGYQDGGVAVKINEHQHLELDGDSYSNVNLNTMSFSAWIKPDSVTGMQPILSRYGLENNVKFQMVDDEIMLSINNADYPTFTNLALTKTFDVTSQSFTVSTSGSVRDSSGGTLYVFPLYGDYSTYLEDLLLTHAKTLVTPVTFKQDNINLAINNTFTTFNKKALETETENIQYDSDFYVYFVAIDALGNTTIDRVHNTAATSSTPIDANFVLTKLALEIGATIDGRLTLTTPATNNVGIYATAYTNSVEFPYNHVLVGTVNAGLTDEVFEFSLTDVNYFDGSTTQTFVGGGSSVNAINVYVFALDATTGQRVKINDNYVAKKSVEITSRSIVANKISFSSTFTDVIISPSDQMTWIMRFRYVTITGGTGQFFKIERDTQAHFYGMSHNGTPSKPFATSQGVNANNFPETNNTWHTVVCRIVEGSPMITYVNGIDYTSSANTTADADQVGIHIDSMYFNNDALVIDEIDYFVVVPDQLTTEQMKSVYTDYEGDIEGFLVDNELTPSLKYTFENNNTNTGSASGLPAITFQTPEVYNNVVGTKKVPEEAPHATVQNALFKPFENEVIVSNITAFSAYANVVKVYDAIAFAEDVDVATLTNEYLKTYVQTHSINSTSVNYSQFTVGTFESSFTVNKVRNLAGDLIDLDETNFADYKICVVVEDSLGEFGSVFYVHGSNTTNLQLYNTSTTWTGFTMTYLPDTESPTDAILQSTASGYAALVYENFDMSIVGTEYTFEFNHTAGHGGLTWSSSDSVSTNTKVASLQPYRSTWGYNGVMNGRTHQFGIVVTTNATFYIDSSYVKTAGNADEFNLPAPTTEYPKYWKVVIIEPTADSGDYNDAIIYVYRDAEHLDPVVSFYMSDIFGYATPMTTDKPNLWVWGYASPFTSRAEFGNLQITYPSSSAPSVSTLRTNINTAELTDTLTFSGEVIPDETNPTTYHALATTKPLSSGEVRTLIQGGSFTSSIITEVGLTNTSSLNYVPIDNVIITSDSDPLNYQVVPSANVNYANVYLYATDDNPLHDDIDHFEITTTNSVHVHIPNALYKPFKNVIVVSGATVFSSKANVVAYYQPIAFTPSVDLSSKTEAQIINFITNVANITSTPLVASQYNIANLPDFEISVAYNDFATNTTEELNVDNVYQIYIIGNDSNGINGIGKYVNTSGYLSVRDVDWSALTPDNEQYELSKASPGGSMTWCETSADGNVVIASLQSANIGSAYVWRYNSVDNTWTEDSTSLNVSRLPSPFNTDALGGYGANCALSADGNIALISGNGTNAGCAYIWRYIDGTWTPDSTNLNSAGITGGVTGAYGVSSALSADGNIAVVCGNGTDSGCGYVWRYDDDNGWEVDDTTLNSSRISGGVTGKYGLSCHISSDGNTIILAGDSSTTVGCAYVWRYNKVTGWVVDTSTLNSTVIATDILGSYGISCCLNADGTIALVSGDHGNGAGCAYIWRYSAGTWTPDSENLNSSHITPTVTGSYGRVSSLSADGNTALVGGHQNVTDCGAYIWQYENGEWTYTNISNTSDAYYCYSGAISKDGSTAVIGIYNTSDTSTAYTHIWRGINGNEKDSIPFIPSTIMTSNSTLRTYIETAALNNGLTFTGEVVPDSTNPTTYHALATTKPLTSGEVRTLIQGGTYVSSIESQTGLTDTTPLDNIALTNVLDTSSTEPYQEVSSTTVNYANVYLYATDGINVLHDDIDHLEIITDDTTPYFTIPTLFRRFENDILISGATVFSSFGTLNKVYHPLVFDYDVPDSTLTSSYLQTYTTDNGTTFTDTSSYLQYSVITLPDYEITKSLTVTGTFEDFVENGQYKIRILVEDGEGNFHIGVYDTVPERSFTDFSGTNKVFTFGSNEYGVLGRSSAQVTDTAFGFSDTLESQIPAGYVINNIYGTGSVLLFELKNIINGTLQYYGIGGIYVNMFGLDNYETLLSGGSVTLTTLTNCIAINTFLSNNKLVPTKVACSDNNIHMLCNDGYVYAIGPNSAGQLCNGGTTESTPGAQSNTATLTLCTDIQTELSSGNIEIIHLVASNSSAMVVYRNTSTGQQYAKGWGNNTNYELWNGSTQNIINASLSSLNTKIGWTGSVNTYEVENVNIINNTGGVLFRKVSDGSLEYMYMGSNRLFAGGSTSTTTDVTTPTSSAVLNTWIESNPNDIKISKNISIGNHLFIRDDTSNNINVYLMGPSGNFLSYSNTGLNALTEIPELSYYPGDPKWTVNGVHYKPYCYATTAMGIYIGVYDTSISFAPSASTLRTTITSTETRDNLTFTGEVIADETNPTTYHALATTKPLTSTEVRTLIQGGSYVSSIESQTGLTDTTPLDNIALTNVLDTSSTEPYQMAPSYAVNYANVYLYATDGTLEHDDIDVKVIDTTLEIHSEPTQFTNVTSSSSGAVSISPDGLEMSVNHTAEIYVSTGLTIDISDNSVGQEYEFELFWTQIASESNGYGGFTFGSTKNTTVRTTPNGYYVDFYQFFNDTNQMVVRTPVLATILLNTGYTIANDGTYGIGLIEGLVDRYPKYLTIKIVSDGKKYDVADINDIEIRAYLDKERTEWVYTIPNMSQMGTSSQPTSSKMNMNIWSGLNFNMHFNNFNKLTVTPEVIQPFVTIPNAQYRPFENDIIVSGATVFSSKANVVAYYPAVTFAPSVDLSSKTDEEIITFITTVSGLSSSVVNHPQYSVGVLPDSTITVAYNDNTLATNTSEAFDAEKAQEYQIYQVVVDDASSPAIGLGKFEEDVYYIQTRDVDWSTVTVNSPTYPVLNKTSVIGRFGECVAMSADGTVALVSGKSSTTAGCAYVWRLNVDTDTWIADDATDTTNHLSSARLPSPYSTDALGNYGIRCAISADGNVVLLSGHDSLTSGCAYVWRYNTTTTKWGIDGILNSKDLIGSHGTDTYANDSLGYYGQYCDISADGNTVLISAYTTASMQGYIWRYDSIAGSWYHDTRATNLTVSFTIYTFNCAISGDGKTIMMSKSSASSSTGGSAYIWTLNEQSGNWDFYATPLSHNQGRYGDACSLSYDGKTALVSGTKTTTGTGYARIWRYNATNSTWEYDSTNDNLDVTTSPEQYGMSCSLSADGNMALVSGTDDVVFVWTYNGTTTTWTNQSISNSGASSTTYGKVCHLSADGTTAIIGNDIDASSGNAYIWKGSVGLDIPTKILVYGSKEVVSTSTLRTTIETAELNNGLTFTGEVVPDSTNPTTYHALATTKPLTSGEVRTLIQGGSYVSSIESQTGLTDTTPLDNIALTNVLDTSSTEPYQVAPYTSVNYANVYLYATDGINVLHDDIDHLEITPFDTTPFFNMPPEFVIFEPFNNTVSVSNLTVFSSVSNIVMIYPPIAFSKDLDISNDESLRTFIENNVTPITISYEKYKMINVPDTIITHAFNDLNNASSTELIDNLSVILAIAIDDNNEMGIGTRKLYSDKSEKTILETDIYTKTWTSFTPIEDLTFNIPEIGYYVITCSLFVNKTDEDGGIYKHNGNVGFELSVDNGTTWTSLEMDKKGFGVDLAYEFYGNTQEVMFSYKTVVENTQIRPKAYVFPNGNGGLGSYWFGYFLKDYTHMSYMKLPDNIEIIELCKHNSKLAINTANYILPWRTGEERINTSTNTYAIKNTTTLNITEKGTYLFILNVTIENNATNGHGYTGVMTMLKDSVFIDKSKRVGFRSHIGSTTVATFSSIFIDTVDSSSDYQLNFNSISTGFDIQANAANWVTIRLDDSLIPYYGQFITSSDETLVTTYENTNKAYLSQWSFDSDNSTNSFNVSIDNVGINILKSGYYTIYINLDFMTTVGSYRDFIIIHLHINGVQIDSTQIQGYSVSENRNLTKTGCFDGIKLNKGDVISVGIYMAPTSIATDAKLIVKANSTMVLVSHYFDQSVASTSTLRTTIETAELNNGFTFTGEVIADETNPTTYHALATTKQLASADVRDLIINRETNGLDTALVLGGGLSENDDIQVWVYKLNNSNKSSLGNADHNLLTGILMFDTPNGHGGGGNRIQYTTDFVEKDNNTSPYTDEPLWDILLDSTTVGHGFDDDHPITAPIIKLTNIDSSVKSIYLTFYEPNFSFDFKIELRVNGSVVGEYMDETQSVKTATSTGQSILKSLTDGLYGLWNLSEYDIVISSFYITNQSVLNVIDTSDIDPNNYQVVPSTSVNYANLYLYATDGTLEHDDIDVKVIDTTLEIHSEPTQFTNVTSSSSGAVSISPDGLEMSVNHTATAEIYVSTGLTIDISDNSIGQEYEFEMFWTQILSETSAAGGFSLTDATNIASRGSVNNGYYIDFYQIFDDDTITGPVIYDTDFIIRHPKATTLQLNTGYTYTTRTSLGAGALIISGLPAGQFPKYFTAKVVSSGKQFTSNDFELTAYLDSERTQWVYKIPNMSDMEQHSSNPNTETIYVNLWGQGARDMHFNNFRKVELTPEVIQPFVTIPNAQYRPFENDIVVSGATVFSSKANVVAYYPAVTFAPSVDLSSKTDEEIITFITTVSGLSSSVVNHPQYSVGVLPDTTLTVAYNDFTSNTSEELVVDTAYQIYMIAVDDATTPNTGISMFNNTTRYLSISDVDWSSKTTNSPDHILPVTTSLCEETGISADGKVLVYAGSGGIGYVWRLIDGTWVADHGTDTTNVLSKARLVGKHPTTNIDYSTNTYGGYGRTCAISADGNVIVISAHGNGTTTPGNAFVWRYDVEQKMWNHEASLISVNLNGSYDSTLFSTNPRGGYGVCCDISASGNVIIVSGNVDAVSGCAYIWRYKNGTWTHNENDVLNKYSDTQGNYGTICSLSADGNVALIAGNLNTTSGCGYVWRFDGSTWTEDTTNMNKTGTIGTYGFSCDISADGNTVLIAGHQYRNAGVALIWRYSGGVWKNDAIDDLSKSSTSATYGYSCSLSSDGNIAIIAGDYNNNTAGCAYILKRDLDTGVWSTVDISHSSTGTKYGYDCGISSDGSTIVVAGYLSATNSKLFIFDGIVGASQPSKILYDSGIIQIVPSTSTLRTTIASAEITTALTFTGEVVPDSTTPTTYYAIATTSPLLDNETMRNLIKAEAYAAYTTAFVTESGLTNVKALTNVEFTNVVDTSTGITVYEYGGYPIVPASSVNYANVYLYATDGVNVEYDDIDVKVIDTTLEITGYKYLNQIPLTQATIDTITQGAFGSDYWFDNTKQLMRVGNYDTGLDSTTWVYTIPGATLIFDVSEGFQTISFVVGIGEVKDFVNEEQQASSNGITMTIEVSTDGGSTWTYMKGKENDTGMEIDINAILLSPANTDFIKVNAFSLVGINRIKSTIGNNGANTSDQTYFGNTLLHRFVPEVVAPHVTVTSVSPVSSNTLTVSGSAYSSKAEITTIKAIVFAPDIDLDALDEATIKTFINTNGTSITTLTNADLSVANLIQYEVGQFVDFALTTVYTSTDLSATTNEALDDLVTDYEIVVIAIDDTIDMNIGLGHIPYISTRVSYHSSSYQNAGIDNLSTLTLGNGDVVQNVSGGTSHYTMKHMFNDTFYTMGGSFHGSLNPTTLQYTFSSGPKKINKMVIGHPQWNWHLIGAVTIKYYNGTSFVDVVNQSPLEFENIPQQTGNLEYTTAAKFETAGVSPFQVFNFNTVTSDIFQIVALKSTFASSGGNYPGFGEWEIWGFERAI